MVAAMLILHIHTHTQTHQVKYFNSPFLLGQGEQTNAGNEPCKVLLQSELIITD